MSRFMLKPFACKAMQIINFIGCMQAISGAAIFIAWTLTSFLWHESGKMFLQMTETDLVTSNLERRHPISRFVYASVLTIIQCLSCVLFVRVEPEQRSEIQSKATTLLKTSHVLATLATNYSLAYIEAASTVTIKLTEPVTMAIAHHVIFRTAVPLKTVISIPLILYGALVFTDFNNYESSDTIGISLAFASNIILTARNIILKKLQNGSITNATVKLEPYSWIALTSQVSFMAALHYLGTREVIPTHLAKMAVLCLTSGVFHVVYSYISTTIVLKVMNVVSHSIANIFKRFLVVLMLYTLGTRQVSASNFLGLFAAVCGLLVYTHGKTQPKALQILHSSNKGSSWQLLRRTVVPIVGLLSLVLISVVGPLGRSSLYPMSRRNIIQGSVNSENRVSSGMEKLWIDFTHSHDTETDPEMQEFLSWRLVDHHNATDRKAKTLTNNRDVVEEAQRILLNLLQDLLGKARHVMLIEIATYDNKGDPAITVGEVMLLRKLNVTIVYYCETYLCNKNSSLDKAQHINSQYGADELVILLQGGGNLVGYIYVDHIRKKFIDLFPDRKVVLLSQSIFLHSKNVKSLTFCRNMYSNHSNLIMLLRDRQSYEIAAENFQGVKLILAPDMAFGIGMVPRQMPPTYDIIWIRRADMESSNYGLPIIPANISVEINDWIQWKSNRGKTDLENSFLIAAAGFQFLERGRVVITDRLHGHILSTLMDIPHVLVDNPPYLKLSSFDRSWTQSLKNTIIVSNGSLALDAAMTLLNRYQNSLPVLGPKDMYVPANG